MSETEDKARIAELEGMVKTLLTRLSVLERQVNPAPRPPEPARLEGMSAGTLRLLDSLSVPKEILEKMQAAVPDHVVREIAKDGRR
jgi:hypothetical protein